MSEHIFIGGANHLHALQDFLDGACSGSPNTFVFKLAEQTTRWSTVEDSLSAEQVKQLHGLAYSAGAGNFSHGNLKAHYVLDEDFVDGGTALIIFALVGSTWTYVVRVTGQAALVPIDAWLKGSEQ